MLRVLTSRAVLARGAIRTFATTAPSAHTPLSALSTTPEFFNSVREGTIPAFRLLGPDGLLTEDAAAREWVERAKQVDGDKLKRMLEIMTMMPILVSGVLAPRMRQTFDDADLLSLVQTGSNPVFVAKTGSDLVLYDRLR